MDLNIGMEEVQLTFKPLTIDFKKLYKMNINFEIMKKIKFRTFAAVIITTCLVTVVCTGR